MAARRVAAPAPPPPLTSTDTLLVLSSLRRPTSWDELKTLLHASEDELQSLLAPLLESGDIVSKTWELPETGALTILSTSTSSTPLSPEKQKEAAVILLRRELQYLDKEIATYQTSAETQRLIAKYIHLLHDYNERKDLGQSLLGNLGTVRGCLTRDLYPEFGLELTD